MTPMGGEIGTAPGPGPRALYAAFDVFPSAKGAATHIDQMARTLFEVAGGGLLYVLGDERLPRFQREGEVEIHRHPSDIPNLLERAMSFGGHLARLLERHGDGLALCHFRDPWSGLPILERRGRRYATVYEVNGLPSIELPYAYPLAAPSTLAKLRALEVTCWREADRLVTPSRVIAENLARLGADPGKITVIPNGAEPPGASPRPPEAPARYLIYIGAMQRWQGVDVLLRAYARLADLEDLYLVVVASTRARQTKPYRRLAERLGIAERVLWRHRLGKAELDAWLGHATLSVAPLTECTRNLEQGCCPLKVLESLAAGVPVVAADLPAVREILRDGEHGRLVRPDRPAELARAIRVLLEYPDRLARMGAAGVDHIQRDLSWGQARARLASLYRDLLDREARSMATSVARTGGE